MMEKLRLWWFEHGQMLGLVIATTSVLFLGVFVWPRGRMVPVEGRVAALRWTGAKSAAEARAVVEVDGRTTLVRLSSGHGCAVGSRIVLTRSPTLMGTRYQALRDCRP